MAEQFNLVGNYVELVGLLTQLVLITLQLRLYRSTRHNSAVLMAASTALGIIYLALMVLPRFLSLPIGQWLPFHEAAAVVLTIEGAIGIAGVVMLFRAFEAALARTRPS